MTTRRAFRLSSFLIPAVFALCGLVVGQNTAPETAVGQTSVTLTASVTLAQGGAPASVAVVTKGAPNLDFKEVSDSCVGGSFSAGQFCLVNYTFAPQSAGERLGGIVVKDGSGNVLGTSYVAGIGDAPVGLFSAPTAAWTASGFSNPRGISVDGYGNLYVADTSNNLIKEIPAGGGTPQVVANFTFDNASETAGATAVDGAGNLYAISEPNNELYELIGGAMKPIAAVTNCDDNLEVDGAGNLYTSNKSTAAIYKIAAGTHVVTTPFGGQSGSRFIGMAVDPAGDLFVADYKKNALYELPAGGSSLTTLVNQDGNLNGPHSVALDAAGNIYVGNLNSASGDILRYASGTLAETTLPAVGTASLAIDGQGNIFTILSDTETVAEYSRNSAPTAQFAATTYGSASLTPSNGEIEFENDGNTGLDITAYGASSNFGANGTGNTCATGTMDKGQTCEIVPSFAPMTTGALTGTVTLTDNTLGEAGTQQAVNVSGEATAATLTVTASSPTAYAGIVPVITANYSGFVLSDSASSVTTAPTCTTTQTTATPAGTAFTTSCSGGAAANYSLTYVSGGGTVAALPSATPAPTTAVGQSAPPQVAYVTFTSAGTLGSVSVVTGGMTGMDFNAATGAGDNACVAGQPYAAGAACAVAYTFTPTTAGQRLGAVLLQDGSGNLLGTTYLSGVGTGAVAAYLGAAPTAYATTGQTTVVQVAMDARGDLFYGNTSGGVSELPAQTNGTYGAAQTVIAGGLPTNNFLHAAGFDGAGNLYLGDNGHNVVYRAATSNGAWSGSLQTIGGFGGDHPQALAADAAGNVYVAVCCSGNLYRIAPGATTATLIVSALPNGSDPEGMVVDGSGNVWVAGASQSNSLIEIAGAATGSPVVSTHAVSAGSPWALGIDAGGDIYYTNGSSGSTTLYRIPNGSSGLEFGSAAVAAQGLVSPREIEFAASGNMVVSSSPGNIYVYEQQAPGSQSYPQTKVGSNSTSQTQTVVNIGNADLTFGTIAYDANYPNEGSSCGTGSVATGTACAFTTEFVPTVGGTVNGQLQINDNAVNETAAQVVNQTGVGTQQPQSITFTLASPVTYGGQTITLNGAASSGLAVSYSLSAGAPAIVNGNSLTITGIGTFTVTATQAGDAQYAAAASVSQSLEVDPEAQTINFAAPATPVMVNGTATLSATATSGEAVVYTITAGTASVNGSTVTYTNAGPVTITANAPATGVYAAAAPVAQTVQVNGEPLSYGAPSTNVGQTSGAQAAYVNFTAGGTLQTIAVVTQGAANQDFNAATTSAGDACQAGKAYSAGQACEVDYTFAPQSAGTREGGIVLQDGSGNVLGTSYLGGVGNAPLGLFSSPVATRTVSSNISTPRGLSVDGSGNVYFANIGDGTLKEIPAGTTNVVTVLTTAIGTGATAVDGAGNLYLADEAQTTIFQVVNGGLTPIATGISPDDNLEVDGAGNLYTSDYNNGGIYKIDAGTHQQHTLLAGGQGHRFIGMHVDPAGNIFAADFNTNTLYELPAGASTLTQLASGAPLNQPHSVAVDPAGNVYVGNLNGGGIMRYAAGTWQETTLPAAGTTSLAIDGLGNIYANISESAIAVYARNVAPTVAFAATAYGQTSTTAPGEPIEFENDGNLGLAITGYSASSNFGANGGGNSCGVETLNSGATCEIAGSFTPLAVGGFTGTLTLSDNNLNNVNSQQPVNLNGTGVQAGITVTAGSPTITYGQPVPAIGGTVTSGALVGGDTLASIGVSCAAAGTPAGAGTYATSCAGNPANYAVSYVGGTLTIGKAGITVTAGSPTITYGQAVPGIGGTVTSGALVGADTLGSIGVTCAATGAPANAGTYATSCTGDPANYAVSFVGGTLTIGKAGITVTAGSPTITYGQAVPGIGGTVTSGALVGSDTLDSIGVSCAATGTPGNAGTYATSCTGDPANYAVSFVGGTLTIGKAGITVTAGSPTITYGQPVPGIGGTVTSGALVGTDTLATIGVTCAVVGAPGNAGTYATSCAGNPANYAVSYVGGTLTIGKAGVTVTAASPTITYGQAVPAIGGTVTSGALVGSDTLGSIGVTCAATGTPGNAGTYATSCAGNPANYAVSYVGGALTIGKAGITVTAASQTITYGQPVPAIGGTVTLGSLVGSDTLGSIGVSCGAAGTPVNAGTYATSCAGNPANYAVSYVGGTLTIVPAAQTISFTTIGDQVFSGVPLAITLNATASSGLPITYTVSGGATLGGANGNVLTITSPGAVTVTAQQAGSNDYLAAASVAQTFQAKLGLGYGLYATASGCYSMAMAGHVRVDSFDSSLGAFPAGLQMSGGNLGTNGTLMLAGDTRIFGTLFDPNGDTQGHGCDRNHPVSLVMLGDGDHDGDDPSLSGGIQALPAALVFPAPAPAAVAPPTTPQSLTDGCNRINGCSEVGRGHVALTPGAYGNLTMADGLTVDLSAGTYSINSLRLGNATVLHIVSGPVVINLAGANINDDAFDSHTGWIDNPLGSKNLVILYGGRYDVELSGDYNWPGNFRGCDGDHDGDDHNCGPRAGLQAIIYAPYARVLLSGGAVVTGTIVGYTITAEGDVTVHYDRSLAGTAAFSGGSTPPACTTSGDHDHDACSCDSGWQPWSQWPWNTPGPNGWFPGGFGHD